MVGLLIVSGRARGPEESIRQRRRRAHKVNCWTETTRGRVYEGYGGWKERGWVYIAARAGCCALEGKNCLVVESAGAVELNCGTGGTGPAIDLSEASRPWTGSAGARCFNSSAPQGNRWPRSLGIGVGRGRGRRGESVDEGGSIAAGREFDGVFFAVVEPEPAARALRPVRPASGRQRDAATPSITAFSQRPHRHLQHWPGPADGVPQPSAAAAPPPPGLAPLECKELAGYATIINPLSVWLDDIGSYSCSFSSGAP